MDDAREMTTAILSRAAPMIDLFQLEYEMSSLSCGCAR
jgi:hypothetical protein